MAQSGVHLDRESFSCSICLDLLKVPVGLNCGHSYCMDCIKTHWDGEDQKKRYSCPQCRQAFATRPVLLKNTMLADLVEQLKKTGLQAAAADHCFNRDSGPGDVACDFCTGRKLKAFKSCLQCVASYCEKHLQPHYDVAPLKKHKLVEPSKNLQENLCPRHDEVMKIFCRTDQQCICYLCSMDEHKGHDTVSAAVERTERQRELEGSRLNIQQRITDVEKHVQLLQHKVEAIDGSADKAVEHSEKTFTELIRLIQRTSSDVKQQLRNKQQTDVSQVRDLQEKLEQEITELKRRDAELKTLAQHEDHNQFLQDYRSLSALSESTHSPSSINIRPLKYFEDVTAAVSEAREKLQDVLRETWTSISLTALSESTHSPSSISIRPLRYFEDMTAAVSEARDTLQDVLRETWTSISLTMTHTGPNISLTETQVDVLLPQPEPKTRADFLRYYREITLDPNTAHKMVLLSDGNRKATYMSPPQSYPSHTDRFSFSPQVLSSESLTGRCYWEVEWRAFGVGVAVAYKTIGRAGGGSAFGYTDKSCALYFDSFTHSYNFFHNKVSTRVSYPRASDPPSSRIRLYLERAGFNTRLFTHKQDQTPVSGPQSSRIGVYLDHSAGVLSFYSVSETMTLLQRVQTTFTQPLYAGVMVNCVTDTAEFSKLN